VSAFLWKTVYGHVQNHTGNRHSHQRHKRHYQNATYSVIYSNTPNSTPQTASKIASDAQNGPLSAFYLRNQLWGEPHANPKTLYRTRISTCHVLVSGMQNLRNKIYSFKFRHALTGKAIIVINFKTIVIYR
jgi:hypothetical protein